MMVDFFPSGAGIGSYPFWIKAYFEPGTDAGHLFHKVVSSPHNFILDFLIDFGLWGGLLLGFGFWSIARGLSNEVLKPRRMEFLSYWALIFIQGLLIQPISFQPLAIFFIGYLYYKSTEFLWTLHSARFKWMAYVQILSLLPLVYFTFNYGLHLYRTKDLLNLYETLNEKNYVDMPKLIELQKSGFKDPRMDRLFLTNAQISKNIKNVHAEARVLLEKTNYLYPLEFSLASTYAANGQWAECVETIDVDLQKFGRNNYTSLNLKAECLFKLNCEDFLKWKQTMQGYFGISLDYKYPIWYQRSCNTP